MMVPRTIIQKYSKQYHHLHLIAFYRNRGTNAARNAAIAIANGDFCIILDSDDYLTNDAIQFIYSTIIKQKSYSHYLFAPDDMQNKYHQNPLLNTYQTTVTYQDFLTGKINGDFIHVIKTDILKKYPFDENLRIHEGVFFMRFYKEAQKILFTNHIVTIRERSRKDSVTREAIRTNKYIINRIVKASDLYIEWFANDLKKYGYENILRQHYLHFLDNLLLISEYTKARNIINVLQNNIPFKYRIIYSLRLGFFYRKTLAFYLWTKYSILKSKLQ